MTALDDLSCQELVELVSDHLEGTLDAARERRLRTHLAACTPCATYVEQMDLTIALTGRVESAALSPEARRQLLAVFADWAGGPRVSGDDRRI